MASLNPTLSTGFSVEQPVAPAPSGLGALSSLISASGVLNAPATPAKPTAAEREGAVLQDYSKRIGQLQGIVDPRKRRKDANSLYVEFIGAHPEYASEAKGIYENVTGLTIGPEKTDLEVAIEAEQALLSDHLKTPSGQLDFSRARVNNPDGSINMEQTTVGIQARMLEREQRELTNEQLRMERENAQWTREVRVEKDRTAYDTKVTRWTGETYEVIDGLAKSLGTDGTEGDNISEYRNSLLQIRESLRADYTQEATAAGLLTDDLNTYVTQALKPIEDTLAALDTSLDTSSKVNSAFKAAADLDLTQSLVEAIGPQGANPTFQEIAFEHFLNNGQNKSTVIKTLDTLAKQDSNGGAMLDVLPGLPTSAQGSANTEASLVVNPKVTKHYTEAQAKDPQAIPSAIKDFSSFLGNIDRTTLSDPKAQQFVADSLSQVVAASSAYPGPLGGDMLRAVFNPTNISTLQTVVTSGGVLGQDIQQVLNVAGATQISRNLAIATSFEGEMAKVGVSMAMDPSGKVVLSSSTGVAPSSYFFSKKVQQALDNINYINSQLGRVSPEEQQVVWEESSKGIPAFSLQGSGEGLKDETEQFLQGLSGDTTLGGSSGSDTLESLQLISLIDKKEGGGDYDTLLGFSNREGGKFAGTKVSQMTLDEASDFSQGDYAQFSKGLVKRVATPMGRYQIVGTTLRQTMKEMGLPGNLKFSPEVQDAMFLHLAKKSLSGKNTPEAKRKAMRGTWEGFKSVSDKELDAAIAEFEGTEVPTYVELQQGGNNMSTEVAKSPVPEARPLDFGGITNDPSVVVSSETPTANRVDPITSSPIPEARPSQSSQPTASQSAALNLNARAIEILLAGGLTKEEVDELQTR